ncbi:MAG TPA: type II CAAX endopeptidase family protein [Chitinophagaceae bacterium]|nr:type II CAAX endopeptidase family protein [Chitinophagaceae bacterium]
MANKTLSKIFIVIRSILLGLVVAYTAILPQDYLTRLNYKLYPLIPWSFFVVAIYIFIWLKIVSGRWIKGGSQFRSYNFRNVVPEKKQFNWGLITGGFFALSIYCLLFLLLKSFTTSMTLLPTKGVPFYLVLFTILTITAVAGISEEVGFRGYMQKPIEDNLGKTAAILITSVLFTVAHIKHAEFNLFVPVYFSYSCMLGLVAVYTRSLLPSIILHFLFDFMVFSTFRIFGKDVITLQVSETGITPVYLLLILGFFIGIFGGYKSYLKLKSIS